MGLIVDSDVQSNAYVSEYTSTEPVIALHGRQQDRVKHAQRPLPIVESAYQAGMRTTRTTFHVFKEA